MIVMFLNLNKFGITIRNKEQEMRLKLKILEPLNRILKKLKSPKPVKLVNPKRQIKK